MKTRILLIDDDPGITVTLQRLLTSEGHEIVLEKRGDSGLERATREPFDLVLTDLKLPGVYGLDLVRQLHGAKPRLPIIVMTAHGSTETAIEATKLGAFEYLVKPFEMPDLLELLIKALAVSRLMSEPVSLGVAGQTRDTIIGTSKGMQEIYKEIGRAAAKPVNVLICGETGSGKELVARALYQHSERAKGPFIAINCAAIPETLLESELFGHERGAFTGAEMRRIGRFEQADGGTLFLDEIGDMTLGTQVKLVRVLQDRLLQRLGGKETIPIDVRVIAATHRDLERAIEEKQFREDLFYRLSVVTIRLPALRDRREDIPQLVAYFLKKHGESLGVAEPAIHPDAMEFLQAQPWPGNVRELENVVRKVLLLAGDYTINADHVRTATSVGRGAPAEPSDQTLRDYAAGLLAAAQRGELERSHARLLEAAEQEIIRQAIRLTHGNQLQAARLLGISRLTLREKLTQLGLRPGQQDESPGS
jgi:two-component system, NtrC family, response regulator